MDYEHQRTVLKASMRAAISLNSDVNKALNDLTQIVQDTDIAFDQVMLLAHAQNHPATNIFSEAHAKNKDVQQALNALKSAVTETAQALRLWDPS